MSLGHFLPDYDKSNRDKASLSHFLPDYENTNLENVYFIEKLPSPLKTRGEAH